jgi:hypothetical protein
MSAQDPGLFEAMRYPASGTTVIAHPAMSGPRRLEGRNIVSAVVNAMNSAMLTRRMTSTEVWMSVVANEFITA